MIRIFDLFCKLKEINNSDEEWFTQAYKKLRLSEQVCPVCGVKGDLEYHDSYLRDLISLHHGHPVVKRIRIKRYRCNSCGHTHALLPEPLIPYSSYSLRFVIQMLTEYLLHQQTVEQICRKYQISHSTLYAFYHLFLAQKRLFLGGMEDRKQSALRFLGDFSGQLAADFFQYYHFSFFQGIRTADFHPH